MRYLRVVKTSDSQVFLVHSDLFFARDHDFERFFVDINRKQRIPKVSDPFPRTCSPHDDVCRASLFSQIHREGNLFRLLEKFKADVEQELKREAVTLVHLEIPGLCQVALAGWMLGYPVVYVLLDPDDPESLDNCLGDTSLVLHTSSTTHTATQTAVTLTRFSCPSELRGQSSLAVEEFRKHLAARISLQSEFCQLTLASEMVTLHQVVV